MPTISRLTGRFFSVLIPLALAITPLLAQGPRHQLSPAPTLCQISDTVYRADGTPAQGTALISWPAFTTAAGQAVTPGSLTVTLDAGGGFNASLAPNTGASPAGTYYRAIFKLDDDTVQSAWAGEYRAISDFLPAGDIIPANAIQISAPSRGASFTATIREVELQVVSLRDDRSEYLLRFSNDAAEAAGLQVRHDDLGGTACNGVHDDSLVIVFVPPGAYGSTSH